MPLPTLRPWRSLARAVLTLFTASLAFAAAPAAPKLNVVFIVADDLNCDLGAYGAAGLLTPNIDRLAARGVRFDRAYCQFPLCSPSRSSFLTGRRPNATGVLGNPNRTLSPHLREKLPQTVTLPELFKKNGWFSARVGKLYHYGVPSDIGTSSLDDFYSWDQVVNPRGLDREVHDKIFSLERGQFGGTLSWLADEEGTDLDHTDGIGATEAVRLLERFKRESRPFFLAVGFYRPHTPFVAPKAWFDLYPTAKITLPSLSDDDRTRTPAPAARGGASAFLNVFYPGDREDTERRRDGSDQQALTLMNNTFVMTRTRQAGTGPTSSLLRQVVNLDDRQMVDTLFLNVLSRYPNESVRTSSINALRSGNRSLQAENLLWTLYNKVDFTFNY